jgi:hypothetical protein
MLLAATSGNPVPCHLVRDAGVRQNRVSGAAASTSRASVGAVTGVL